MKTNNEMTFLEHILELRSRLLKIFFSIMFFSIIGYLNSNLIISFLLYPVSDPQINLQVLKITSIFSTKLMVALFFGLIISFPILLYQLLSFITPAFDNNLTVFKIIMFICISLLLLIIGLFFGYYILIPFSVTFFKSILYWIT